MVDLKTPALAITVLIILALVINIGTQLTDGMEAKAGELPEVTKFWPIIAIMSVIFVIIMWIRKIMFPQEQSFRGA